MHVITVNSPPKDFVSSLPNDVLHHAFSFLSPQDLAKVESVSKSFQQLLEVSPDQFEKNVGERLPSEDTYSWKNFKTTMRRLTKKDVPRMATWKDLFFTYLGIDLRSKTQALNVKAQEYLQKAAQFNNMPFPNTLKGWHLRYKRLLNFRDEIEGGGALLRAQQKAEEKLISKSSRIVQLICNLFRAIFGIGLSRTILDLQDSIKDLSGHLRKFRRKGGVEAAMPLRNLGVHLGEGVYACPETDFSNGRFTGKTWYYISDRTQVLCSMELKIIGNTLYMGMTKEWTVNDQEHYNKLIQVAFKVLKENGLYTEGLKNRELGKEAPQIFCSEQATIAERQGASESEKFETKPTLRKTDSSVTMCINRIEARTIHDQAYAYFLAGFVDRNPNRIGLSRESILATDLSIHPSPDFGGFALEFRPS
jgi:hypothetical protein